MCTCMPWQHTSNSVEDPPFILFFCSMFYFTPVLHHSKLLLNSNYADNWLYSTVGRSVMCSVNLVLLCCLMLFYFNRSRQCSCKCLIVSFSHSLFFPAAFTIRLMRSIAEKQNSDNNGCAEQGGVAGNHLSLAN